MDILTTLIVAIPMLIVSVIGTIIFYWVLPWMMIPTVIIAVYIVLALLASRKKKVIVNAQP